jgi:hypothetical protein
MKPPGQLPAGLPAPAAHRHQGAELRHRKVDVHEKPSGVVGERGSLPPERVQDRAHVGHEWIVWVWAHVGQLLRLYQIA